LAASRCTCASCSLVAVTPLPPSQPRISFALREQFTHPVVLVLVLVHSICLVPTSGSAMGGLCSKSANEADPFAQPGRLLGSGNTDSQPSSTPPPRKLTSTTPGRTLGGTDSTTTAADDARSAAARAAEVQSQQCHCVIYPHLLAGFHMPPPPPVEIHTVPFNHVLLMVNCVTNVNADDRSVQPKPPKAPASSPPSSRHRRSRPTTSFWPPAPSKSGAPVMQMRPRRHVPTIDGFATALDPLAAPLHHSAH
jgi:hypothetical protein